MPKKPQEMQSWQVMHYARKHLGRSALYAIFGKKNARAVDLWCENPRHTAKNEDAYDPIAGIRELLDLLDDLGHDHVVRACLGFLNPGSSAPIPPALTDLLPTMAEEKLADFARVAEFQAAIDEETNQVEVNRLKILALEEIERTYAKYLELTNR